MTHEHEGAARRITFLDTPGHEAFTAMRSCGAEIADVAVLVVAADDGVKPQTLEALSCIVEAGIPYVVALSKIDKPEANVEKAKTSLLENGVYLEGLGGDVPYTPVSAKTGEGVPALLDLILLSADLQELTGTPEKPAEGVVLEAHQDAKRGVSATLVLKNGTLATGSYVVAGASYAPVRFIENFLGERVASATFSSPVRIVGFTELPPVGTPFTTVASKKEAEALAKEVTATHEGSSRTALGSAEAFLPIIIKADVAGGIPAVLHELKKIVHEHMSLKVLTTGVGSVNERDIKTAIAAPQGVVVGFHTTIEQSASDLADRSGIEVRTFDVIYELSEYVASLLSARAPKVSKEEILGRAKLLKTFNRTGTKQVIGGRVLEGELRVKARVRILRREIVLGEGKLINLQIGRVDTEKVAADAEFGAQLDSKVEPAPGDILEAYHIVQS